MTWIDVFPCLMAFFLKIIIQFLALALTELNAKLDTFFRITHS